MKDKVLTRVLKDAYRGVLIDGLQPVGFLQLWMDPDSVDVNVHPAKSEVRLRDERSLFGFLVKALKEAVMRTNMATPGESMIDRLRRREGRPMQRETLPDPGPWAARAPSRTLDPARRAPSAPGGGAARPIAEGGGTASSRTSAVRGVSPADPSPPSSEDAAGTRSTICAAPTCRAKTYLVRALPTASRSSISTPSTSGSRSRNSAARSVKARWRSGC